MKKYIFLIAAILLMCMAHNLVSQQVYGRWVVPTVGPYGGSMYPSLLTFDETPIISESPLGVAPTSNGHGHQFISAGAYSYNNYDEVFSVVDNELLYGTNTPIQFKNQTPYGENQIIKVPGCDNEYFIFYIISESGHDNSFQYTHVTVDNNGTPHADPAIEITGGIFKDYGGFAITDEKEGSRYLYTSIISAETPTAIAGLRKWEITSEGVDLNPENYVLKPGQQNLTEKDFDAYNMEYKKIDDNTSVLAWSHGTYIPSQYWERLDEIVVVTLEDSDPTVKIIDLNSDSQSGNNDDRIGGIEFSNYVDNLLYISMIDRGIVKINYETYQDPTDIFNVYSQGPDYNYGHTFLQTAPDGHIYGVSNNGTKLGRILQSGTNAGLFDVNYVFEFDNPISTVSTYNEINNKNYYILPENQRVHNYMTNPTVETTPTCPDQADGTATITFEGGYFPFTFQLQVPVGGVYENVGYPVTKDEPEHTFENLAIGLYKCEITDKWENKVSIFFEIKKPPFDVPDFIESITEFVPEYWTNIESRTYEYGIQISGNTSITVTNSKLEFGPDAKIIIEPGSELILDNSTLTNWEECDIPWLGIEVWGNRNKSQLVGSDGIMYQGKFQAINNSEISNAYNAIKNRNGDNYNTSGGIIIVEDCNFINNKRSIELLSYHNTNPYSADIRLPYISKFKLCTFTYDDNYIIPDDFNAHVTMWDVEGIYFYGCEFENNTTNNILSGYGIYTLNAGFSMLECCTTDFEPCPELKQCSFNNLFEGVHASNTGTCNQRPYINNAKFVNNSTGVYISYVDNAIVINSLFEIGPNYRNVPNCGDLVSGFGIDIKTSIGFVFENNTFEKYELAPVDYYTGIHIRECPSPHDIVYNNIYEGLSFGNYTEGTNREDEGDDKTGVEYQCNRNFTNAVDFKVDNIDNVYPDGMIRDIQGEKYLASGNWFSQGSSNLWHFVNMGTQYVTIKYYDNDPVQIPEDNKITYYVQTDDQPQNLCPDHSGGGGSIKLSGSLRADKEQEYADNLADYNSVMALYESFEDGGNTTSELLDIETAQPDEMWILRQQLLGDSPHLSQEVLMSIADRTDVFPDNAIFDILAANPDELREDTLISFLENKEDPLPDYMIDILKQLAFTNTTYKTILVNDMAHYYGNKMQAAKDIVNSILSDSVINHTDYRNWLDNMSSIGADKQIISSYLAENDITSATSLLSLLSSLYNLSGDDLEEYNNYKDMIMLQINWNNQGKTIMDLDNADIATLEYYANNTTGIASSSAKNIL